jgi:heme/copper-type cytochrome/quinol oxidase subunit 2
MDSVSYAAQLGRLDFISALLACIALIVAVFGFYGLFEFRRAAKKKAARVARETTLEYLKNELPITVREILRELMPEIKSLANVDDRSNDYADAQDKTKKKGGK